MDWLIPTLRLLFFTRFSILVALAATVLVPLAAAAKPELLGSLLVLEEPWQLFNITWASLVLAIFVQVSFRITQVNASARFPDYRATLAQEKRAGDVSPRSGGRQETVGRRQEAGGSRHKSGVTVAARARLAFRTLLAAVIARLRVSSTRADRIIPRRVVPAVPGGQSVAEFVRIQERGASVSIQATPILDGDSGILTNSATARSRAMAGWRYRWLFLAMIGLPLPVACVWHTTQDLSPAWNDRAAPAGVLAALAMIGGVVVATLVLGLLLVSQQLLLDPKVVSCDLLPFEVWPWFERLKQIHFGKFHNLSRRFARWLEPFGPGYTQRSPETGEVMLAPGHGQSALWLGIAVVAYLYSYHGLLSGRNLPTEGGPFSALFFYLVLLVLLHGLLTGLAFFLDYYRVPVSLAVIGFSILSSSLFDTEHVYELKPAYNPAVAAVPVPAADLELTSLFDNWRPPRRTLVVVTAAGGGIQAAAWTAQVLAGLDEIYGPDFTRSVGMVSGVSGGSVGTMYYMAAGNWTADGPPFDPRLRRRLIDWSETSSLEATGWGIVYPDFMRSVVPFLVPQHVDRGWAIEQSWLNRIGVDHRLRDWIPAIRNHQMPIPIFNAVLAETGQRLVISPVVKKRTAKWSSSDPCEFFNLYPGDESNLRATTAARLSATFPYVSPISRGDGPATGKAAARQYHVADGGYGENEGLLTVLEWTNQLVKRYTDPKNRPFDRILVIRIQPFSVKKRPAPAEPGKGWTYGLLGPLDTLENVRSTLHAERNDFDLNLVASHNEASTTNDPNEIDIVWTAFQFHPSAGYITPFSWHLTTSQKEEIHQVWRDLLDPKDRLDRPSKSKLAPIQNHRQESPLATLDRFFPRIASKP
jgi:hypothetical protein